MSVVGTAVVAGALAKGALTVGLLAQGHDDYFVGCDCIAGESDYVAEGHPPLLDPKQYWTSVAAGLTVAAIIGIGGAIVVQKGRRS